MGLICDLLWACFDPDVAGWAHQDKAIDLIYGPDVLDTFLRQNNLEKICCSTRVMEEGYKSHEDRLLDVVSASNYCGDFDNRGAVLVLDEHLQHTFVTHDLPFLR